SATPIDRLYRKGYTAYMRMVEYKLKMLINADGTCPFGEWYESIKDTTTRARIRSRITRIQSGNFGDAKSVGKGGNELRMDFGPGYRAYFARSGHAIIVLLGGGDKSTQQRDIEAAQKLWEVNQGETERFRQDFRG